MIKIIPILSLHLFFIPNTLYAASYEELPPPKNIFKYQFDKNTVIIKIAPDFVISYDQIQAIDIDNKQPVQITYITKPFKKKLYLQDSPKLIFSTEVAIRVSKPKGKTIQLKYQGCNQHGLCYPPYNIKFTVQ